MQQNSRRVLLCVFLFGVLNIIIAFAVNGAVGRPAAQAEALTSAVNGRLHLPVIFRPVPPAQPTALYLPAIMHTIAHPSALAAVPFATLPHATETVTNIVHAGDERLFITTREGAIYVAQPDGTVLTEPFLQIQQVALNNWEQGLLGLTFHPDYPNTPYLYVIYTHNFEQEIRLDRYTVMPNNPNQADPDSKVVMMRIAKSPTPYGWPSPVHNGGDLKFGPDGYLYIAVGDGGPDPYEAPGEAGDPFNNSQRENVLLGKILRIDVDHVGQPDCGNSGYAIPPDNPYVDGPGGRCDEIFLKGFRNPWRFSFDRLTGDMFIGDVGEWEREELNFHPAGAPGGTNYGWHCYEGSVNYAALYPAVAPDCTLPPSAYTFPIWEYISRNVPVGGCSVIGGFMYRGNQFPTLRQHYVFGDFCFGRLRVLYQQPDGAWELIWTADLFVGISTFGEDLHGELYMGLNGTTAARTIYKLIVP
jgi:glucose/arabinose dehydrogenase